MGLQDDALFPKGSDGKSFSKDWFYMNLGSGDLFNLLCKDEQLQPI